MMIAEDLRNAVVQFETQHIREVLARYPDLTVAAKRLGISLSTLYRKLQPMVGERPVRRIGNCL